MTRPRPETRRPAAPAPSAALLGVELPSPVDLHRATAEDLPTLMPMVRAFYEHFKYPFVEERKRAALAAFMEDPAAGQVLLVRRDGAFIGYVLVATSFSLELDGTTAFIDELYVAPSDRGKGAGSDVLQQVEARCLGHGLTAVRLECDADNPRAAALYSRSGYVDHGRRLMTKVLPRM